MRVHRFLMFTGLAAMVTLTAVDAIAQAPRVDLIRAAVVEARAKYPKRINNAQVAEVLNRAAWMLRPNVKLLRKTGGGKCPSPAVDFTSCDILIWAPPGTPAERTVHYDVLNGASGAGLLEANVPDTIRAHGPCTKRPEGHPQGGSGCDMRNAIDPVEPADVDEPEPDPGNEGADELADVKRRLRAIEEWIRRPLP